MMGWLSRAFSEPPVDEIADLRVALAALVKRAMAPENDGRFGVDLFNTSIRGIPTGDWRVSIARIEARSGETEGLDGEATKAGLAPNNDTKSLISATTQQEDR